MNCTVDNCQKEAHYTFVWPWGSDGASCEAHKVVVLQKSQQVRGRSGGPRITVSFVPLNPDRPREITRDERIELHSARLTAESERDDARLRATKLFEQNTSLTNDKRALTVRVQQLAANADELAANAQAAIRERDAALVTASKAREEADGLDELRDECESLRTQAEVLRGERDAAVLSERRTQEIAAELRTACENAYKDRDARTREREDVKAELERVRGQLAEAVDELANARARLRETPTVVEGR